MRGALVTAAGTGTPTSTLRSTDSCEPGILPLAQAGARRRHQPPVVAARVGVQPQRRHCPVDPGAAADLDQVEVSADIGIDPDRARGGRTRPAAGCAPGDRGASAGHPRPAGGTVIAWIPRPIASVSAPSMSAAARTPTTQWPVTPGASAGAVAGAV